MSGDRDDKGRWVKGVSGNAAGRPPNAEKIRAYLEPHQEKVLKSLLHAARTGDVTAQRLILERLAPSTRAAHAPVEIPGLIGARTLTEKATAILDAIAAGAVPPDVGERLLGALANYAKALETDELAARIAALEQRNEV